MPHRNPQSAALAAIALLVLASAARPSSLAGQRTDDPLGLGPFGVGFRVIEALDSTRAFRPLRDHRGRLAPETARPVQVSIWYPARVDPDEPRMRAGEFRLLRETEVEHGSELDAEAANALRSRFVADLTAMGEPASRAAEIWDDPTPAVRDAPPLPGPHPTVLYFTAAGVSNPLLPAYLASHGFVVASFPSNGRMTEGSLEFTPNALTLDTDIDDAGFAHLVLQRVPWADTRRLAVAAFSGGSLAALLWAMRDMQAGAVVTVEGWERFRRGADIVSGSVHYEPHRVRVPVLMLERAADEASPQYAKVPDVVEALSYADVTRVAYRDAAHGDFLSHVAFGHTPDQPRIYTASARAIRLFLEATLMDRDASARALASLAPPAEDPFFQVTRTHRLGSVPTEEELYRMAETDPAAALAAYREATEVVPGRRLFREAVLTRAAIFAPGAGHRLTIMQIVADAYPRSIAAGLRLGETLAELGRAAEAEATLRATLALAEEDDSLSEEDRQDWRGRIEAALDRLGGR